MMQSSVATVLFLLCTSVQLSCTAEDPLLITPEIAQQLREKQFKKLVPKPTLGDGQFISHVADANGKVYTLKEKRYPLSKPTEYLTTMWLEKSDGSCLWLFYKENVAVGTPMDHSLASGSWSVARNKIIIATATYDYQGLALRMFAIDPESPPLNTEQWPQQPTPTAERLFKQDDSDLPGPPRLKLYTMFPTHKINKMSAMPDATGSGLLMSIDNHVFTYSNETNTWAYLPHSVKP